MYLHKNAYGKQKNILDIKLAVSKWLAKGVFYLLLCKQLSKNLAT